MDNFATYLTLSPKQKLAVLRQRWLKEPTNRKVIELQAKYLLKAIKGKEPTLGEMTGPELDKIFRQS